MNNGCKAMIASATLLLSIGFAVGGEYVAAAALATGFAMFIMFSMQNKS